MITVDKLREYLEYDKENGGFIWIDNPSYRYKYSRIGKKAGAKELDGYISVSLNRKRYKMHRLVWFYHYGYFPESFIDHIDRNKSNNKIENLREVSNSCNQRNSFTSKRNKTGVRGVCYRVRSKRFVVSINIDGVQKEIGSFVDFDEAVAHRLAAEQVLNWEGCGSSSDAYNYIKDCIKNETKN